MRIRSGPASLVIVAVVSSLAAAQQRPAIRQLGPVVAKSTEPLAGVTSIRQLPGGRVLANAYSGRLGGLIAYKGDSTIFVDPTSMSMLVIDGSGKVARLMPVPSSQDA